MPAGKRTVRACMARRSAAGRESGTVSSGAERESRVRASARFCAARLHTYSRHTTRMATAYKVDVCATLAATQRAPAACLPVDVSPHQQCQRRLARPAAIRKAQQQSAQRLGVFETAPWASRCPQGWPSPGACLQPCTLCTASSGGALPPSGRWLKRARASSSTMRDCSVPPQVFLSGVQTL